MHNVENHKSGEKWLPKLRKKWFSNFRPPKLSIVCDNEINDPNYDRLCQEFSEEASDKMFFELDHPLPSC